MQNPFQPNLKQRNISKKQKGNAKAVFAKSQTKKHCENEIKRN